LVKINYLATLAPTVATCAAAAAAAAAAPPSHFHAVTAVFVSTAMSLFFAMSGHFAGRFGFACAALKAYTS